MISSIAEVTMAEVVAMVGLADLDWLELALQG